VVPKVPTCSIPRRRWMRPRRRQVSLPSFWPRKPPLLILITVLAIIQLGDPTNRMNLPWHAGTSWYRGVCQKHHLCIVSDIANKGHRFRYFPARVSQRAKHTQPAGSHIVTLETSFVIVDYSYNLTSNMSHDTALKSSTSLSKRSRSLSLESSAKV
jgi:hypothetical protein